MENFFAADFLLTAQLCRRVYGIEDEFYGNYGKDYGNYGNYGFYGKNHKKVIAINCPYGKVTVRMAKALCVCRFLVGLWQL